MLEPGSVIGSRYELLSLLGSGGSGVVYAALDRTTEKRVAAKLLGRHMLDERSARERLRLEACVSGRVTSQHIVQVSDTGVDPTTGIPYIIMEMLEGKDLQQLVEQRGPLKPTIAVEYLRQVACGLDKAHCWQDPDGRITPIVHRDLKPSNLFLTQHEDGSPLLKILDFGLAKVMADSATLSGELRGTPLYMAPEQLSPAPLSPATDVWAIGLVAFYLLTGKPYWRTGQRTDIAFEAILREVGEGPVDPPSQRLRQLRAAEVTLPRAFDKWFLRCSHRDPIQRFAGAGEAVQALAVALEVAQNTIAPATTRVPPHRTSNRPVVLLVAGLVAIGAATLGWRVFVPLRQIMAEATPLLTTPRATPVMQAVIAGPLAAPAVSPNAPNVSMPTATTLMTRSQTKKRPGEPPSPVKSHSLPAPSSPSRVSTASESAEATPTVLPPLDPLKHR